MFIDIHAHAYRKPGPILNGRQMFSTPEQLLPFHKEIGIEKAVVLPLVSPEFYLPQSNDDILDMARESDGHFIPFCNVDPRALRNSPDAPLGDLLRWYRDQGFKGIGEITVNLSLVDPLVQNLFKHVQDVGLPLVFHLSHQIGGTYGMYDEPGLPHLEYCLQRFPKLKFLGHSPEFWSEIAELDPADRSTYPKYPVKEEGVVPRLFRKYSNLYGDLSAGSGYNALARDPKYAVPFIREFQNRLLYGTDICSPAKPPPLAELLLGLKKEGKISTVAFNKIARLNAIQLLALDP